MDSEAHKGDQSESQMCIKGCGFFGSSSTENMCSKCYKDHLLKYKAEAIAAAAKVAAAPTNSTKDEIENKMAAAPTNPSEDVNAKLEPAAGQGDAGESKPARCFSCRKRIGLTGFKCRCGNTYCGLHRYAEEHGCSFDYKKHGRESVAKANPLIQPKKIDKI